MAIFFSNTNLQNVIDNGNSVVQSNTYLPMNVPAFAASRSAGAVTTANTIYPFNIQEYSVNSSNYNTGTFRFTAPFAGVYWFYVWTMFHNAATYNNRNMRLRVNDSGNIQQVYCYSSNQGAFHASMEHGFLVQLAVGDFVSLFLADAPMYGSNRGLTRFGGFYVG
jgi:hypothetical protein